jgi:manganese-dependent ADP-ribose/CDP-alcohol diphosphatase
MKSKMITKSQFQRKAIGFLFLAAIFFLFCFGRKVPDPDDHRNAVIIKKPFLFGIVADIQYADKDSLRGRDFRASISNLQNCVVDFNKKKPVFVIQLGDIIDGHGKDFIRSHSDMDSITRVIKRLKMPLYNVIGNHDLAAEKEYLRSSLGLSGFYYDFTVPSAKGWRFFVLDGNDGGYGIMGDEQIRWFRLNLTRAKQNGEKVICFSHYALTKLAASKHYMAKPGPVLDILDSAGCVVAWFAGHDHAGGYTMRNGVHHITIKGMVEAPGVNSYAFIKLYPDHIRIIGKGKEESRKLQFK